MRYKDGAPTGEFEHRRGGGSEAEPGRRRGPRSEQHRHTVTVAAAAKAEKAAVDGASRSAAAAHLAGVAGAPNAAM